MFPGGSRRNHFYVSCGPPFCCMAKFARQWMLKRYGCFLGDPGVTIVYLRSMIWFVFVWIVLSISVFKGFPSIFTRCWNRSTKYLENSSFAPDQRTTRVYRNKDKLVETSSYKSIFERKFVSTIKVFYYKSISNKEILY